jgi:hypothetical protein
MWNYLGEGPCVSGNREKKYDGRGLGLKYFICIFENIRKTVKMDLKWA